MIRPFLVLLAVFLTAGNAFGQTRGADSSAWNSHATMVKRAYRLSDSQGSQLDAQLKSQQAAQDEYMSRMETTLRRMTRSIKEVLPKDNDTDDAERARVSGRMQEQMYRIYANAPLSLTNIVKKAEGMLSQPAINEGRARLTDQLQGNLKGRTLSFENLDQFAVPPVPTSISAAIPSSVQKPATPSSVQPVVAQQPKPVATPPVNPERTNPPITSTPPTKPVIAPQPQPQAATKPEPPPGPAPPFSQWATNAQLSGARYRFTDDQKKQLETIIKSVQDRAQAHLTSSKAEYDAAQNLSEADGRGKKLETLNAPLDKLYSELTRRVDSLASYEQRIAAEKATAITTHDASNKTDSSTKK